MGGNLLARDLGIELRERTIPDEDRTTAVISACSAGESAFEMPEVGHGVFFHFLLQGMEGEAWNAQGLTVNDAFAYARKEIAARPIFRQRPTFNQIGERVIYLAKSKPTAPEPVTTQVLGPDATDPESGGDDQTPKPGPKEKEAKDTNGTWFSKWGLAVLIVIAFLALILVFSENIRPQPTHNVASPGPGLAALDMPVANTDFPNARPIASPDPALLEQGRFGALPRVGADGRTSIRAYAGQFDRQDTRPRIGIIVADIGMSERVLDEIAPTAFRNSPALWADAFPVPAAESNKYTRGQVLVVGGGAMTGAARLAARAAARVGAGLVTLASPTHAIPIYAADFAALIVRPMDTSA
ncbi:MAG: hypothetical protein ACK5TQ_13960, partial [Acetobacteraceae bacterium]